MVGLVTFNDVPAECIKQASQIYHVPAIIILSVLKTEDARNGTASRNKNGSYDYGPLQINSTWLPTLARHGITREDVQWNPCINVAVGTWILAQAITESPKHVWQGVGNYNSHTPYYNQIYAARVKKWQEIFKYYSNH